MIQDTTLTAKITAEIDHMTSDHVLDLLADAGIMIRIQNVKISGISTWGSIEYTKSYALTIGFEGHELAHFNEEPSIKSALDKAIRWLCGNDFGKCIYKIMCDRPCFKN